MYIGYLSANIDFSMTFLAKYIAVHDISVFQEYHDDINIIT